MSYDSAPDTLAHIERVQFLLEEVGHLLRRRGEVHNASKLVDPEKAAFDEMTPRLKGSTYGSDEYKGFLTAMKPALDHHYAHNRHHPEHHASGIKDMTLLDVLEMLADWKAASERYVNGDLTTSLHIYKVRFNISDEMMGFLERTAQELGFLNGGVQP